MNAFTAAAITIVAVCATVGFVAFWTNSPHALWGLLILLTIQAKED